MIADNIDDYLFDFIRLSRMELMKHFKFAIDVFFTQGCSDSFGRHVQDIIKYKGRGIEWFQKAKTLDSCDSYCDHHMHIPFKFRIDNLNGEIIDIIEDYSSGVIHEDFGYFIPSNIHTYDIDPTFENILIRASYFEYRKRCNGIEWAIHEYKMLNYYSR